MPIFLRFVAEYTVIPSKTNFLLMEKGSDMSSENFRLHRLAFEKYEVIFVRKIILEIS